MWAIIAAFLAIGKTSKELEEIALSLNYLQLIDPGLTIGLLKWKKIEKKFKEWFGDISIEETPIPLKIVATNIETGTSKIFTKWKIVDALRASISLPGIFIPKKIEKTSYIDGGIMMNLPIEALSAENIIAVSALNISVWKIEKTNKIMGIYFQSWSLQNNFEIIKRSIIFMMKANEDKSIQTPGKHIHFIRPNFWTLDFFDFKKVDKFINLGYKTACEKLFLHKS